MIEQVITSSPPAHINHYVTSRLLHDTKRASNFMCSLVRVLLEKVHGGTSETFLSLLKKVEIIAFCLKLSLETSVLHHRLKMTGPV